MGLVLAGGFILFMLLGVPVGLAIGASGLLVVFLSGFPLEMIPQTMFSGNESFALVAVPFFVLAGNFLTHGGVARRMINFATSMVGHWYGGLGLAGVMACALFAAVSGSSPATVVAIGSILMPAMVKAGSAEPAKYLPELAKINYKGITGTIAFDNKGDIKNGALTMYTYKGGNREQIAVVR